MIPYGWLFESCNRKLNSVLAVIESYANLLQMQHLFIISDRLFRRLCPLYLAFSSFSFKHKEHLFVLGLYVRCFRSISHTIFGVYLLFLIPHNAFESSVMLAMPEGFYVVCISLFEFGFGGPIIYFVLEGVLI